jgi:cytochrome c oxidase assembly factor CtaG
MLGMKTLGLIISLWNSVIYDFYARQPRAWGLDVMSDQQTGGMLMWMPGGGLMWFGMGRVFWQWVHKGTPKKGLTGIASIDQARAARLKAAPPVEGDPRVTGTELLPDDQPGAAIPGA